MQHRVQIGVGYFGIPGTGRWTKTHLVSIPFQKPLCRVQLHPKMEYQWCSRMPDLAVLECGNCRRIYRGRILKGRRKNVLSLLSLDSRNVDSLFG